MGRFYLADEKTRDFIRKSNNPPAVIPAKAGIWKRKTTGIYPKQQTLSAVIPAQAGI
ncbi:predicted protein [Neisseria gonorrhoeae PID1]|uniref:Uncharacterized protein n=1 Tax=Neisseria gonorrhoeae (strain NCCP11945) TaxID=521006 RepID=B4RJH1_NEIG2|nr:Conserved hypothetical protein [Neisseria gonorrhoeae NCCP11945]EEZ51521.1 predicted protein [Neisseria gonorrhoeae PID1]EEZ53948.1 predicted protein [Neisseria gonorrhoeae PID332]EEZ56119.1 predicted protein [Neisseria gonorrhoeae SK-92-679]EEZ58425.1 predicted protein [Neisseria gonorrhoeae SK-93-1035]SCW18455.1 conserved hypothetical protein [Neisseria gonorrhoeae]